MAYVGILELLLKGFWNTRKYTCWCLTVIYVCRLLIKVSDLCWKLFNDPSMKNIVLAAILNQPKLVISPDLHIFQTSVCKLIHICLAIKWKVRLHLQKMSLGIAKDAIPTEVHVAMKTTRLLLQQEDVNWQDRKKKSFLPSFLHCQHRSPCRCWTGLANSSIPDGSDLR